jgi:hypothetical protein
MWHPAQLSAGRPTAGIFFVRQLAGLILGRFDFERQPNVSPLILDPYTCTIR